MAGFGYKYLAFLVVFHVLAFQAQSAGVLASENPDNRHEKVVEQFASDNLTEKASVSSESGIISETFSPILAISELLNSIIGILVSPYSAVQGTQLPGMLKMLLQAIIGVSEMYTAYLFVRGGA